MRDDMVPHTPRSIRNIPVSHDGRHAHSLHHQEIEYEAPPPRRRRGRGMFWWILLSIIVSCTVLGLLLSTLFAGAVVTVYPRSIETPVESTIEAQINPAAGGLPYVVMTVVRSATTSVAASGTKEVSRPASGVITIYNNHSASSQRLITNTRFEASDGKIYRIREPVTIPGATEHADGSFTPGTISVSVYADSPGEEYNRAQTTFTIPGFKGDPRFETFSATADAITGGFVGEEPAIAEDDLESARALLREELERSIENGVSSQVPEGFLLVVRAIDITYSDITQRIGEGGSATLSQNVTATAAIIRVGNLAAAIARLGIADYTGEAVTIDNPDDIALSVASTTAPTGPFFIIVGGLPKIVWQYDAVLLRQALYGTSKDDFEETIDSFRPAISRAKAKIRPFWKSTFPNNSEKITIETAPEEQ